MTFAEKLRAARRCEGYTQAQCAELLDVAKRTLETWEAGDVHPPGITQEGALARIGASKSDMGFPSRARPCEATTRA